MNYISSALTRRRLLSSAAVGGIGLAAAACTDDSAYATPDADVTATTALLPESESTLGEGSFSLFTQSDLNFQTLLALGGAGMNAEVGEVMTVVDQANAAEGGATYQSVYDAFLAMGNVLEERATAARDKGHRVTAHSQYLRASQYYNQALYWVLGTSTPDAEAEIYTTMNDAFIAAAELADPAWERLEIPYENDTLTGWFMKPKGASGRLPTMIINNGSDGQNIDMVAQGGAGALARGYNVVIFEGPGQGNQLFLENVVFRPDWEKVVTPVLDHVLSRNDVAADQVVLRGISFGGLLVPRAAAYEPRFAAVVADPGCVSTWDSFPSVVTDVAKAGDEQAVNEQWAGMQGFLTPKDSFNLKKRLEIYTQEAHDQAREGEVPTDFYQLSQVIKGYDLGDLPAKITSPTMVIDYELDAFFEGQPRELFDRLTVGTKEFVRFTVAEGAQYHCGPMAPQLVAETVCDWTDSILGR